jgi:CDGSH-type Zn-finger protein
MDLTGDLGVGYLLLTEARRAAEEPPTDQGPDAVAAAALRSELSDAASAALTALDPAARAAAALVEPGSSLVPPARCPAENVLVLSWLALQLLQSRAEWSPPEEAAARLPAARATARAIARLDAGAVSELLAEFDAADAALTARRRSWAEALEALRADPPPAATVTPYRNGPYLLRGDFTLLDEDGNEIDARRGTVALCRCGRSRMRPFCDGTHTVVGFTAPGRLEPADRRVDPIAPD